MKKIILTIFTTLFILPVFAFEDCIITTNAKLTDIKIQNNNIIDVFPLITLMNDKNTLIVHPLRTGKTKFSVMKNQKDKFVFNVEVTKSTTKISDAEGFDILTIDCPVINKDNIIEIDEPPMLSEYLYGTLIELDEPPVLSGE